MLADRVDELTEDVFPTLSPVLVAGRCDAEQVLGLARADLAMLALELRVLRRDLVVAEAASDLRPAMADLPEGAGELLATALEQRVSRRRSELAVDVDRARTEAARLVTAAHREAAAVVTAAREEMLAVLLDGSDPRLLDPPILRVVREDRPALEPSTPVRHEPRTAAPVVPAEPAPETVAPVAAVHQAPEAAARATAPAGQPELPGPPADRTSSPQPSPLATASPPLSLWARYLYADVILPLAAVLIVVVVLLAWVG